MIRERPFLGTALLACGLAFVVACGGSVSAVTHPSGEDAGTNSADSGNVGTDAAGTDAADAAPPAPLNHRPNDAQCLQPPAAGTCAAPAHDAGFACTADTDCTSGTNGRCQTSVAGHADCFCAYDTCASDSACPTGDLCVCHGSAYAEGAGNTCLPGNCRVDSDCGAEGYCSPAHGTTLYGSFQVTGYYCHTSADECVNDRDCVEAGDDVCTWSDTSKRWACLEVLGGS